MDSRPRIGVRGMLSIAGMTNWGAGTTSAGAASFRHTQRRVTSFSYQGMKIGAPVGGIVREAIVPPLHPRIPAPYLGTVRAFAGKTK